jgi:hypothetical protein
MFSDAEIDVLREAFPLYMTNMLHVYCIPHTIFKMLIWITLSETQTSDRSF